MILTTFNSEEILYFSLAVIICITLTGAAQEVAVAAFSGKTEEDTTKPDLNPLSHLDPIGTCTFFLAGFGWPKIHKLDASRISNIRLANLVIGILLILTNLFIAVSISTLSDIIGSSRVFTVVMFVSATTFAYNLLPIPPLGGSYILAAVLPEKPRAFFSKYARFGSFILLALAVLIRLGYLSVVSDNTQAIVDMLQRYIFSVS